jgi:hypothetical protein
VLEPFEQLDDIDGYAEKSLPKKNPEYYKAREVSTRFSSLIIWILKFLIIIKVFFLLVMFPNIYLFVWLITNFTGWSSVCITWEFWIWIWNSLETALRIIQAKGRSFRTWNEDGGRETGGSDGICSLWTWDWDSQRT